MDLETKIDLLANTPLLSSFSRHELYDVAKLFSERRAERTLVDGAVVDPVPAEIVRDMRANLCMAMDAVPPVQKGVTNSLTRSALAGSLVVEHYARALVDRCWVSIRSWLHEGARC